jgi:hypothetical protein
MESGSSTGVATDAVENVNCLRLRRTVRVGDPIGPHSSLALPRSRRAELPLSTVTRSYSRGRVIPDGAVRSQPAVDGLAAPWGPPSESGSSALPTVRLIAPERVPRTRHVGRQADSHRARSTRSSRTRLGSNGQPPSPTAGWDLPLPGRRALGGFGSMVDGERRVGSRKWPHQSARCAHPVDS